MKRPFACIGFSMLFSLVFAIAVHTAVFQTAVVCFALSAVLFGFKFIGNKKTLSAAICCMAACVAMFGYLGIMKYYVNPIIDEYNGKTVTFSGMVVSEPYTNGSSTHFTVKTDTIDGKDKNVKINITTSYTEPMQIYDFVEGKATLSSEYEDGYSYASYYGARNIFLTTYINPYFDSEYTIIHNDSKSFYIIFSNIRKQIAQTFQKYLSYDEASLCTAIITGDREYLRDDVYSAFKNLGVSHMLVVSGLHLSIIASILYLVVQSNFDNRYISALMQILGLTTFALLSGFGFSVRRALVMNLVVILGKFVGSKPDALNTLGLAAFLLCLNPLNVGDIGLLWSFSCTLSIILFANKMTDYLTDKLKIEKLFFLKFTTMFSTAAAAFVGSIPFLILVTGSMSPYTISVNLLTVPFTGILIVCGGFSVLLFSLHIKILAYPIMFLAGMTAKYLMFITNIFQEMPYSSIRTNKMFLYIWLAVTVIVSICIAIFDKRKKYMRVAMIMAAAVFVGLCSLNTALDNNKVTFSVLDVGNGMTLTVKNNDNIVVLNSYGEKYQYNTITTELSNFSKIACLIDIQPTKPEYNYCRRITHDFDTSYVIVNDNDFYNEKYSYLRYSGIDVDKIGSNYKLYIFDDVTLNIITTENYTWQYLNIYGKKILICPMNSDFDELPDSFQKPDIAVISDIPNNINFSNNIYVVVSNYDNECYDITNMILDMGLTVESTNGNGRIDFKFSKDGLTDVDRIYTGGVTRYAENE